MNKKTIELRKIIQGLQPRMIQDLMKILAIPSIKAPPQDDFPFGEACEAALQEFLRTAESLGFRTKNVDHYAGYAEFGPEDIPTMVAGICHLDVVPAQGWADAFDARVEDGVLIGRGSIDDKGPAYAVLYAMKALMDFGYEPASRIRLIVGLDEESGSSCMDYYVANEEIPVASFTADADFPVIHAEKGIFTFKLHWQATDDVPVIRGHVGTVANVIPGVAELEVDEDTYHADGIMGHAAMPEVADNALSRLMADIGAQINHPFVKAYNDLIGKDYNGQRIGLDFEDEVSGKLTLNAGILDANKEGITLTCNVRYPVTSNYEDLCASLSKALTPYPLELELFPPSVPLYFELDHPLVKSLSDVYLELTGDTTAPIAIGGGTYARSVPNTVAFGPSFPGEQGNAHQKNENVSLQTLERACEIYAHSLMRLAEEAKQ